MWLVCCRVGMWSVCGWYVVGMWVLGLPVHSLYCWILTRWQCQHLSAVCGGYVVGMSSVCVVGMWLVCCQYVVGMWVLGLPVHSLYCWILTRWQCQHLSAVCGGYVVGMSSVCVVGMWLVCCRYVVGMWVLGLPVHSLYCWILTRWQCQHLSASVQSSEGPMNQEIIQNYWSFNLKFLDEALHELAQNPPEILYSFQNGRVRNDMPKISGFSSNLTPFLLVARGQLCHTSYNVRWPYLSVFINCMLISPSLQK